MLRSDLYEAESMRLDDKPGGQSQTLPRASEGLLQKSKSSAAFRLRAKGANGVSLITFQRPLVYPEKRAEAGVVINETIALAENKSKEATGGFETNPMERKINLKMHKGGNNKTTLSFFCKELQEEHRRLGMNPEEVKNTPGVHPFYRYVPEHLEKDKTYEGTLNIRKSISMVVSDD